MRDRWSMLLVFVLTLVLVVGCEVRPFSDLENDDDNATAADDDNMAAADDDNMAAADDDEESETNQAPRPIAPDIETALNTPGTSQVDPNDPDADDTHTFEISTDPENGTAEVDEEEGLVTYTPDPDFDGPDELEVRVTDDGDPSRSGVVTIDVTVTETPAP